MIRRALFVALIGLGATASAAPAAAPRALAPLRLAALPGSPFGVPVRDRVLRPGSAAAAALPRRVTARGRYYRTKDHHRVFVVVSPSYRSTPAVVQSFVDFLGDLPHGAELGQLRLVIETPEEIPQDCRSYDAIACYTAPGDVLRIPGEEQPDEPPLGYVVAHEYGHHVAWHRSNAPFPAITFGPKRWASAERVCPGFAAGKLFPGDEGRHYFANPGENWAETFARSYYAEQHLAAPPWRYSPLLRPDAGSLRVARADVKHPWRRRTAISFAIQGRAARRTVATPLDGLASTRVWAPRGTEVRTRLVAHGRNLPRVRGLKGAIVCGPRSVQLRVLRTRGRGPVRVTVLRP